MRWLVLGLVLIFGAVALVGGVAAIIENNTDNERLERMRRNGL